MKKTTPKSKKVQRWSIGIFKNKDGELVTGYCSVDGKPFKSEQKRGIVGRALFHATYTGMSYAEARAQLLVDVKRKGGKKEKAVKAA